MPFQKEGLEKSSYVDFSKSVSTKLERVTGDKQRERVVAVWNTIVSASYLGYVGKFFSTTAAPLRLLTMYSLVLNAAWRLNIADGVHITAAASTIGLSMLIAYWALVVLGGPDIIYGFNETTDIVNYDVFDDLMLHLFFPLEAFVVACIVKQVYRSFHSLLELFLFALLYMPFFVRYRPYSFTQSLTTVQLLGVSFGVIFMALLTHCILVFTSNRIVARIKSQHTAVIHEASVEVVQRPRQKTANMFTVRNAY